MTVVMTWLGGSRLKRKANENPRQLSQPLPILIIGVVCTGFFLAIAIVSSVTANPTTTWLTTSVFIGFALLGVPLISLYFTDRHEVSDAALKYNTLLGQRREMRRSEVTSLRYSIWMKWFELRDDRGRTARLSAALKGLPEFARVALAHVGTDAMDDQTARLIRATADGNPPAIW